MTGSRTDRAVCRRRRVRPRGVSGAGGFDERLFAYWEDVDSCSGCGGEGYRCALAADARGVHEHSATLGSGSARKNYLMGFGRGYVLRKWRVLSASRFAGVMARAVLCAGQAIVDRNVAGLGDVWMATGRRGRPSPTRSSSSARRRPGRGANLLRRVQRRGPPAFAHTRNGSAVRRAGRLSPRRQAGRRSLEAELTWLAGEGALEVVVPGAGGVEQTMGGVAPVTRRD